MNLNKKLNVDENPLEKNLCSELFHVTTKCNDLKKFNSERATLKIVILVAESEIEFPWCTIY